MAQSDEKSFVQSTTITLDGTSYTFDVRYEYDGVNALTKASYEGENHTW